MNRYRAFDRLGYPMKEQGRPQVRRELTDALRDPGNIAYDSSQENGIEPWPARELAELSERLHRDADALIGRFEEV